jgi:hypothetical protein
LSIVSDSLYAIGFDYRNDRGTGDRSNLQFANCLANAGCAAWNCEPLKDEIIEHDLRRRQRLRDVAEAADDPSDLSCFAVGECNHRGHPIGIVAHEVIQLPRSVVVYYDGQVVSTRRLNLKLVPNTREN